MDVSAKSKKLSRRTFIAASGAVATGLAFSRSAFAKTETLAVNGGAPAVKYPANRIAALTKWPRYGKAEKAR
ncbi:MAG: hypothetical protein IT367_14440, partial [Candidatus Hydrogenedentes bacterium]|nr:hypothetical protein [Candidatus Hydrogenedentota bacterium]